MSNMLDVEWLFASGAEGLGPEIEELLQSGLRQNDNLHTESEKYVYRIAAAVRTREARLRLDLADEIADLRKRLDVKDQQIEALKLLESSLRGALGEMGEHIANRLERVKRKAKRDRKILRDLAANNTGARIEERVSILEADSASLQLHADRNTDREIRVDRLMDKIDALLARPAEEKPPEPETLPPASMFKEGDVVWLNGMRHVAKRQGKTMVWVEEPLTTAPGDAGAHGNTITGSGVGIKADPSATIVMTEIDPNATLTVEVAADLKPSHTVVIRDQHGNIVGGAGDGFAERRVPRFAYEPEKTVDSIQNYYEREPPGFFSAAVKAAREHMVTAVEDSTTLAGLFGRGDRSVRSIVHIADLAMAHKDAEKVLREASHEDDPPAEFKGGRAWFAQRGDLLVIRIGRADLNTGGDGLSG